MLTRCLVVVLALLAIWPVATFGLLRSTEDLCLGDLRESDQTGYRQTGEFFPPAIRCELTTNDGTSTTIEHPFRAWAIFLTGTGLPALALITGGFCLVRFVRRSRGDSSPSGTATH